MRSNESSGYTYSARPVRNPFRYAVAVWRLVRSDPTQSTREAAIVEMGFARSRLGRRFARWEQIVDALEADPRTAPAVEARGRFGPIVLKELEALPPGSVGCSFAEHCRTSGLDPNLIQIPPDDRVGWMLNHLYQTHDIWHVVTGWGNDLAGEVGLGAFYAAQLRSPAFFGYMMALIILTVISRRADLDEVFASFSAGFRSGRAAKPLFGADWNELLHLPLTEVREHFGIECGEILGLGIGKAA
jgi:ubiquinone biosynthesis protein COQ4